MDSFYVEPKISRLDFDGYGNTKSTKAISSLDELLKSLVGSQLTVVQAGAGGGKSRLARELAKRVLASSRFADGEILPTVEHARGYVANPREALQRTISELRGVSKSEGKALFFIDGFDEVDLDDKQRSAFVEGLIKAACEEEASIVLLSRPFDEVSILGGRVHSLDVFRIEPLKGQKAIDFLTKIAGQIDVKSKLMTDLNKSALLKALDGAPIAYILLGRLIAENQQDLPSSLTELFQKYSELALGRWEMAKGLRSQQEYEVIVESLIWLSTYLLDNQLNEIAQSELEQWMVAYCNERSIQVDSGSLVVRMCDRNSVLYVRSDVRTVGFRHRAFAEFFYAKHLNRKTSVDLSGEVFSPYWLNSYYFLAGIQRDCPDLLLSLLELELNHESERIIRALNFGNLLLAGYLTPITVCKKAVHKVAFDVADMFVDACDPESKSALTQLPTIQMLCALTAAYQSQYGYKHFRTSLEEAIFEVEAGAQTERAAIALFLMDTAYKESGGALRFDSLIEKFGDSLPLVVKLAIQHESERMKVMSDRVKRMERNLRRTFRANKGSHEFLNRLYKIPVNQLDKKLT